jgi:hypothetical protein
MESMAQGSLLLMHRESIRLRGPGLTEIVRDWVSKEGLKNPNESNRFLRDKSRLSSGFFKQSLIMEPGRWAEVSIT